jgi:hypothetical protein
MHPYLRKDSREVYAGVSRLRNGSFRATLSLGGSTYYLGVYSDSHQAAYAYNLALIRLNVQGRFRTPRQRYAHNFLEAPLDLERKQIIADRVSRAIL